MSRIYLVKALEKFNFDWQDPEDDSELPPEPERTIEDDDALFDEDDIDLQGEAGEDDDEDDGDDEDSDDEDFDDEDFEEDEAEH